MKVKGGLAVAEGKVEDDEGKQEIVPANCLSQEIQGKKFFEVDEC